jgi:methylmalonyl-CoA/ethylmalonyl-CoA epimerase
LTSHANVLSITKHVAPDRTACRGPQAAPTAFYRDVVGLPLLGEFDPPGLTFFDLGGGTRLLLEGPGATVLYLGVDDIVAAHARLVAAGVAMEGEPHLIHTHDGKLDQPAGTEEWMCFFHDSEGNLLGLCERRGPSSPH